MRKIFLNVLILLAGFSFSLAHSAEEIKNEKPPYVCNELRTTLLGESSETLGGKNFLGGFDSDKSVLCCGGTAW